MRYFGEDMENDAKRDSEPGYTMKLSLMREKRYEKSEFKQELQPMSL